MRRIEPQTDPLQHGDDPWEFIPGSQHMRRQLESVMRMRLPTVFGFHQISVGPFSHRLKIGCSRTRNQWCVDVNRGDLHAQPDALPLLPDSVDVVVLPLTLDFCAHPHDVLREANRVLIGDGHLIIIGLNPWSWWGVRRLFSRRKTVPWSARFFSAARVKDWLNVLGFEIETPVFSEFRLPVSSPAWLRRFEFFERWCKRHQPPTGAFYIIVAQKRVWPLTPMRLRKRRLLQVPILNVGRLPRREINTRNQVNEQR
jgi:SAM-dependent methyltransferase